MGIFKKRKRKNEQRDFSTFQTVVYSTNYLKTNKNTTVISCKNMLIDTISNLPIRLYFKKNNGERVTPYNHPLYYLFKFQPNGEEPISLFIGRIVDNLIEHGNAFLWKQKNSEGEISSLYVLDSLKVTVQRNTITNQKVYVIEGRPYTDSDVLHIPGKYYDGLQGQSLTNLAKDAINLSNRLDDYTSYHFENMINGGRLKINIDDYAQKNGLTDGGEETQNFIKTVSKYLNTNYTGEENAGKSLILPPGVGAEQLETASNQNQQLAELRELQERYICNVFDIPYDIFKGDNKYNSLEQRNELFKNRTLQFWTTRIADFLNMLLTPYERERIYFEFDYNNFLKTDKKSRTENQVKQLQNGILTINEIRTMENQPKLEEEIGDVRFIPNTFIPLTEENINAYFSKSKLALEELGKHNTGSGDDKS